MNARQKRFLVILLVVVIGGGLLLVGNYFSGSPWQASAQANGKAMQDAAKGKDVYKRHCLPCHQENGSGVPSMYPPIAENPRVVGDKETLIKIILEGQEGPVEVHGQTYNGVMAGYAFLSDEKIAALVNYLRSNFDNDAPEIQPEDVAEVRASLE